jgi:hypothetical protein
MAKTNLASMSIDALLTLRGDIEKTLSRKTAQFASHMSKRRVNWVQVSCKSFYSEHAVVGAVASTRSISRFKQSPIWHR